MGFVWFGMGFILRLDEAIWLRIISKTLLTQKLPIKIQEQPQKGGSPNGGGRVSNVCLGPVRHLYTYTSAAPCISMHVVILILMLQQSQMQGVQRLHL